MDSPLPLSEAEQLKARQDAAIAASAIPGPKTEGYRWAHTYGSGEFYETLYRPDGSEVTTITEPEDRTGMRDLAPIVTELDALRADLTAAQKEHQKADRQHQQLVRLASHAFTRFGVDDPELLSAVAGEAANYEHDIKGLAERLEKSEAALRALRKRMQQPGQPIIQWDATHWIDYITGVLGKEDTNG